MKISQKLISMMLVLLVIPSLIIGMVGYFNAKSQMDELGNTTLKNGVEMAIQLIDAMNKEVEAGNLTLEEAQERVKEYLIGDMKSDGTRERTSPVDLGENGYFIVYDEKGLEVAHPTLEGKNVWEVKDVNGLLLVQEQIKAAKDGGFVTYTWNLPNEENKVAEKVTYNKLDPNWGWVVSAGTYKMDFNKGATSLLYVIGITLIIALIIGTIASFIFSKRIAAPIRRITAQVKEVAEGNLAVETISTKSKDEIGVLIQGFNTMVTSLRGLIRKVDSSINEINGTSQNLSAIAEETTASSEEIHKAIEEISKGAVQQASDADDTNLTTHDLADQIQILFEKTKQMESSSSQVVESNDEGLKSITILKGKSFETTKSVEQVRGDVFSLAERVNEIEVIIGTINRISEQTNLLALNASIEAARAGEQGKGFAVVAQEVRKLAEETSNATEKVRNTISAIMEATDKATDEMENTQGLVQEQADAVNKTENSFRLIASSIEGVRNMIDEVNGKISSLMTSKDKVLSSIENIASISEESAATIEEITSSVNEQLHAITVVADSATELDEQINGLKKEINKFIL